MRFRSLLILASAGVLSAGAALAHHSTAMFDRKKVVTIVGVVTEYQWTNPHVFIELDVPEGGAKAHYSIEAGDLRTMTNFGWKARTLKPGDRVTLTINPLRSGAKGGLLSSGTLSDGRTLRYEVG
ncbi:DUF6152 family protein [Caulobacter sp. RHG1]|uniref:DUF6152 family protein n=1 Tax=Caulobacter sp. (strain RHG1) TaxID=2545762 RepID=UPI001553B3CF|nr:DUF6152 family protein [Caulobacter sp. RHG1]NQE61478.1 hypothetical protein [Caulobacter sp. RHG1]